MYCNRLHAWWSIQSLLATLLSSLIAHWWVGLQTLWRFQLKDLSIDEMLRAWCFGCYQAHWVYLLDFICSRIQLYLPLSHYLCFVSFLYLDLYVPGDDALISLGSFIQTKQLRLLIHIWTKGEVGAPWNRFKPSSKIFLLTDPMWCFFCGSFMFFLSCFCYAFVRVCLLMPCGHLLGKGWPLGSRLWWLSFCEAVTFPLVSYLGRVWCLIVSIPDLCPLSFLA